MALRLRCKVAILGKTEFLFQRFTSSKGDSTVGKTALAQMFKSDGTQFPKNYTMTVGAELITKVVPIPNTKAEVELFLFDISGKDFYQTQLSTYLEGTAALMFVYDITNAGSFASLTQWIESAKKCITGKTIQVICVDSFDKGVLIANKQDADERAEVKRQLAQEFAHQHSLELFECSAFRGMEVNSPFVHIATAFYNYYKDKLTQYETLRA